MPLLNSSTSSTDSTISEDVDNTDDDEDTDERVVMEVTFVPRRKLVLLKDSSHWIRFGWKNAATRNSRDDHRHDDGNGNGNGTLDLDMILDYRYRIR